MKKIITNILVFALVLSMTVCHAAAAFTPTADKLSAIPKGDDVIVRFAVGSDIHIGYGDSVDKLKNAYAAMKKIGGVDAFIAAGDLTENGRADQLATYQSIVAENSEKLTVDIDSFSGKGAGSGAAVGTTISAMGNHECYNANVENDFREQVGQETDKVYWLEDKVPVIKVSLQREVADESYSSFVSKHDFIKKSVEEVVATGYKGHIFLISHISFADTLFGAYEEGDRYDPATREFLENYPQIVHVVGHTHPDPKNPGVIDQSAGFTSVVTGTVGKFFRQSQDELYGSSITVFDVKKDGTTELYRVDLSTGQLIYGNERWILDSAQKPEDFIYFNDPAMATNPDAYCLKGSAPIFGENVKITAKDRGDFDSAEITFTANAKPASDKNYDYVESYRIDAVPVNGGETRTLYAYNDPSVPEGGNITAILYGLEYDTDYEIYISAYGPFGKSSSPVKADGTVNVGMREGGTPELSTMYYADYSYGDSTDAKGHEGKLSAPTTLVFDKEIGKMAASFTGMGIIPYTFKGSDIDTIRHSFSIEMYFKPTDVQSYQTLMVINGADVQLDIENGTIKTYFMAAEEKESYYICDAPIKANEWTHIVFTYDSKFGRMYVNGVLASEELHSGGLRAKSSTANKRINIGGLNLTEDNLAMGSKVNMFALRHGVMTDEDVLAAYKDATVNDKVMAFSDVASTDWFYPTVGYAYDSGLMSGTSDTTFAPATQTSRAMIVQLLYNMEGRPAVDTANNPFTDVPSTEWYAPAVLWAYQNGVTTGTSATTFSPDALVTREQVAVFLYRYMKDYKKAEMSEGADISAFPDAGKISPYAGFAEAVAWANGAGIVTGKKSGDIVNLAPQDKAQRSETATMFARFHKAFVR